MPVSPPAFRLPTSAHVGAVALQIANLDRSLAFYRDAVGFAVRDRSDRAGDRWARLAPHADGRVLLELREKPGIRSIPRRGLLGLYHFALLLPDRSSLGRFVRHLNEANIPAGAADHVFSEALYLTDPDGITVEVYRDRPRETWRVEGDQYVSASDPLDLSGLLQSAGNEPWTGVPAGSVIGHVHFYVDDLARAESFYHRGLGLDKTIWSWPGALFMSAGGYHHHVATNTWIAPARTATDDDAGLIYWELLLPDRESVARASASLQREGAAVQSIDNGTQAKDAWGIVVHLVAT